MRRDDAIQSGGMMMMSETVQKTKRCAVCGRELVSVAGDCWMHKDVLERIEAEWDKVFGDGKGQQGLGELSPGDQQ